MFRLIALGGVLVMVLVGLMANQPRGMVSRIAPQPGAPYRSNLPDYGLARELNNSVWLNTDKPLRLATLRGQVVLLEFWTFGCINCVNTLPYVKDWYSKYQDKGLTVIGNHFPEFSAEHDIQNIAAALHERQITYPIAQDNDGSSWSAYNQRYWPTMYLIDKAGHIRYQSIGEGRYEYTEHAINDLLAETVTPDMQPSELHESYVSTKQAVRIYRRPASDDEVIGTVEAYTVFNVLETREGWYRIPYNDGEGYLSANPNQVTFVPLLAAQ
jgi:thiol-disulfide isomerase/thioredoxin